MPRFVVSHRLRGAEKSNSNTSQSNFASASKQISVFADIMSERPPSEHRRGLLFITADARDIEAKRRESPEDVLIEPELPRQPARFLSARAGPVAIEGASSPAAGIGALFELTVQGRGFPLTGANVTAFIVNLESGKQIPVLTITGRDGKAAITYNPNFWVPAAVTIVPRADFWSALISYPKSGITLEVHPLSHNSPLEWWHRLLGITYYSEDLGKGIRIGLVDTGVGPHSNLAHVRSIGAFINGGHDNSPSASVDAEQHGTHVAGIIGARLTQASHDVAGIAPGAELIHARVYPTTSDPSAEATANNGDIAAAIDSLVADAHPDLINLSLGGARGSQIEEDAIQGAIDVGVLVICAAGNGNGASVTYPAAYPGCVAISAVGLFGTTPQDSVDALATPVQLLQSGLFAASFNSIGPQIACAGPGVGIISTVPSNLVNSTSAYAAMSGTSMACPAVCATLAILLSKDPHYATLPRNRSRAIYAWSVLIRSLRPLGLGPYYEGYGLMSVSR